ncbi:MAG: CDP-alcohol phosphatidyltransferase family protein [Trueperaceae bacterium]|nr:CDP-alcohol phosphatidyltransferase family protein [Trueperaceae bacterium]
MIDCVLRPVKTRLLAPLAGRLAPVPPAALTAVGLAVGLAAAGLAAAGRFDAALLAWLANRLLDGLDGDVARASGRAGPRGAFLDLMADLTVYAAVPLGLAAGAAAHGFADPVAVWSAAALAVAAFYVNLGSLAFLSAALALEAEGRRAGGGGSAPGLHLPAGLIEGAETVVLFTLALALPAYASWTLGTIAALVFASALQRVGWGARRLAPGGAA